MNDAYADLTNEGDLSGLGSAYNLLGQIFLNGLNGELISYLETIPEFQPVLRTYISNLGDTGSGNQLDDLAAADHYDLLGTNVLPYVSVFLAPDKNLGGLLSQEILIVEKEIGYPSSLEHPPEHIGELLMVMDRLNQLEASADESEGSYWRNYQRDFIQKYLIVWIPLFAYSIKRHNNELYSYAADMVLDLVNMHLNDLNRDSATEMRFDHLQNPPNILEDTGKGIKDIAEFILTPVYSGMYLSRDDITRLARKINVPRGFGSRLQILTNLFRSAGSYDLIESMLIELEEIGQGWKKYYSDLTGKYDGFPESIVRFWDLRVENTMEVIGDIRKLKAENAPE